MTNWIDTIFSTLPKKVASKMAPGVADDIPKLILQLNVEQLMRVHKIKNAAALSDRVSEKGLSLSKAQIQRVITANSDSSGSTVIKISAGLSLKAEDYFYLYSAQGFDLEGEAIAKYYDIDHDILIDCAQDAYTVLADKSGNFEVEQFIKMAVSGYRTIARRKKDI